MNRTSRSFVSTRLWQHLEPRVLFDAAPEAEVVNAGAQEAAPEVAIVATSDESTASSNQSVVQNVTRELVIIDSSVDNYQSLMDDLLGNQDATRDFEVFVIDTNEDGIARLTQILAGRDQLDALHIISHGENGAFRLGNTWVNEASLTANAGAISAWGDSIKHGGDILLYGCDVAGNETGRELVESLAALTQQQVAASDDDTGAADRGGDWNLEFASGSIESQIAVSESARASYRHVLAAGPTAVISADQDVMIGEEFTFQVTFDNTGTDTGFGPYIELLIPATGTDGDDGITFEGATYLGQSLTTYSYTFPNAGSGVGTINHPFFVDSSGAPLTITGNAGDRLIVIELPFGSVTPGQPAMTIDVRAAVSDLADLAAPLTIQTRSGFRYGEDALANPITDPSIVSDSQTNVSDVGPGWSQTMTVTPTLMTLEKEYLGPEDETATGPNFNRQYQIVVNVADGQTISNLDIIDSLPNNIIITSIASVTVGGAAATYSDNLASLTQPGNAQELVVTLTDAVVGGTTNSDVVVTINFYVPEFDSNSDRIIPINGEDDTTSSPDSRSLNNARAVGDWNPVDTRDTGGINNAIANPAGVEHTLDNKSIAIQKSVAIVGGGPAVPGAVLEYTLNFQISDYYTFGDLVIDDIFQDGQLFDFGFGASFNITDFNGNVSGTFTVRQIGDTNTGQTLVVDQTRIDLTDNASENPLSDGSTTLRFDVSKVLTDNGAADGVLQGGLSNGATNLGAAIGTIRFRTVIQEDYADTFPSNDRSIDQGDVITNNNLTITGSVRQNAENGSIANILLAAESDTSAASIQIAVGTIVKQVYAINGSTTFAVSADGRPYIEAGDVVTYQIRYQLPTSDVENFRVTDFLPLPIFKVNDHNANGVTGDVWALDFDDQVFDGVSGTIELGASDDFFAEYFAATGLMPTLSVDIINNQVTINYGNYDDTGSTSNTLELYITVTAQDAPTADGLFLTNFVRVEEGNTQLGANTADDLVQVEVLQPVLNVLKGVIAVNNGSLQGVVGPTGVTFGAVGSAGVPFTGTIGSDDLFTGPINANAIGLDAGDRARFAITVENTGRSSKGAFDVTLTDTLPPNMTLVGSVRVFDGAGNELTFTGDLFGAGIVIDDPSANQGSIGAYDESNGSNILLIVYEAEVALNVIVGSTQTNITDVINFAGREGGENHVPMHLDVPLPERVRLVDAAQITIASPSVTKTLDGTSIDNLNNSDTEAVIGELVNYTIVVNVPEGNLANFRINDLLDNGLVYINGSAVITATAGLATSQTSFASVASSATVTSAGRAIEFDFGTLTNSNTNNAVTESITITLQAVVNNAPTNNAGVDLNNQATVSFNGSSVVNSSPNIEVLEPVMNVSITSSASVADVANAITFTLTIQNVSGALGTDAHDVNLEDILPAGLTFVGNLTHVSGVVPTSLSESGGTISANWATFAMGGTSVITFDAITNSSMTVDGVTNAVSIDWSSLSGDRTTPQSTHNAASTERTGSSSDPGADNDYNNSDDVSIAFLISPSKSVIATSEVHTDNSSVGTNLDPVELAIGEIVTYQLRTIVGEGTLDDVVIRDLMTPGLLLLPGTVTFQIFSNSAMTVAGDLTGANAGPITLGAGRISTTTVGPNQQIDFDLGTIVNADNDVGAEEIVITFQAIVTNTANNDSDSSTAANHTKTNSFVFREGGIDRGTSNTIYAEVVEPEIENVNKRVLTTNATGTQVTYQITFTNTGDASAMNVQVLDTMAAELTLNLGSFVFNNTGVINGLTIANSNAGLLDIRIDEMAAGASFSVEYTVNVAYAGSPIQNDAEVTYTSLPGSNGTASATPGVPGAVDGERTGSGVGVNGYLDSESAFLGSISDHIFYDINGNGVDDPSDEGIPGVTVNLVWFGVDGIEGNADDVARTTTTDSSGNYLFSALPAGSFRISVAAVSLPSGVTTRTYDLNGIGTANTTTATLTDSLVGIVRSDVDFGYTGSAQLGDRVWLDIDGDGTQDAGEMGLANVVVNMTWHGYDGTLGNADDISYSTTTDNDGNYNFVRLPAGSFTVDVDQTTAPAGTFVTTGNDPVVVVLTTGQDYNDADFGFRGPGVIGDLVFFDSNNNGVFDAGVDAGFPGVTVTWTADIDGDSISETFSTVTDNNGAYSFVGLPLLSYTITITPPVGTTPTYDATGPANNSSVSTLTVGAPVDNSQDFGLRGSQTIGDRVFWDHNGNGAQNGGEPGLAGVNVQLEIDLNSDSITDLTLTTTTGANGSYQFDNLPPGSYTVIVAQPAGTTRTVDADGLGTPNQSSLTLTNGGGNRLDQDFGYNGTGSIGDLVYFDYRGDGGAFNAGQGDYGLGGVDVTLSVDVNGDTVSDFTLTTTTASDGSYSFTNLVAGDYTITVDSGDTPDLIGGNPTVDANGTGTPHTSSLTLTAGAAITTQDFGYHGTPDYNIVIDDGQLNVVTGQSLTYTVTVRNDGTLRGNNAVVTVAFPNDLLESVAASTGGIVDIVAGTITWNATTSPALAVMNVNEEVVFTITTDVIGILDNSNRSILLTSSVTDDLTNGIDPTPLDNTDPDRDQIADIQTLKNVTSVIANGDNWDVSFELTVINTGSVQLDQLTLFDDLASQFGTAYVSVTTPVINATGITLGTAPTVNASWASDTSLDMLDPANISEFFAVGESYIVTYTVTLNPDALGTSFEINNIATAGGVDITTSPGTPLAVTDISDSGASATTTNPGEPGDMGTEDDPTPVYIADVSIAKIQTGAVQDAVTRNYVVGFSLYVENIGTVTLDQLSVLDGIAAQFGNAFVGIQTGSLTLTGATGTGTFPVINSGWESDTTLSMIDGTGASLDAGDSFILNFNVIVDPDGIDGLSQELTNQAIVAGRELDENGNPLLDSGSNEITTMDLSDSGANANTNNLDEPGDSTGSDDPTPVVLPEIGVAKRLVGSVASATPGNRDLTYELVIRNLGTVDLFDLSLLEDLDGQFGTAFKGVVTAPVLFDSNAFANPTLAAWDGNAATDMFDGTSGILRPGEEFKIRFTIEVDIDDLDSSSFNQVTALGDWDVQPGVAGINGTVSDLSDTGTDPAGNNPGNPGDSGGFDDPTLVPAIGVAKDHGDYVELLDTDGNGTGVFTFPTTLTIANLGATDLTNLNLRDDIATFFGDKFVSVENLAIVSTGVTGVAPTVNAAWMNDTTLNMLSGGLLRPGDTFTITFDVTLNPDAGHQSGYLNNQAVITGSDPSNPTAVVQDFSDSGLNPSTGNIGQPGDTTGADDPTPVSIPDIGLAKRIISANQLGLSFVLTIELNLENTGTVDLNNIELRDDMAAQYGANFGRIIGTPVIVASTATVTPTINAGYAADTSQAIFDGTNGFLRPGESITLVLRVEVVPENGQTKVTVINQATVFGNPLDANGNPLRDNSGVLVGRISDLSDSGALATGSNPGAPGNTGSWDDPTPQPLTFFTFDAFNDFSQGGKGLEQNFRPDSSDPFNDRDNNSRARVNHYNHDHYGRGMLTQHIWRLAPEPIFSGSSRPGTLVLGRAYDSAGNLIGDELTMADVGGNWMMQFHRMAGQDHARFEFTELPGAEGAFDERGDAYGYLGVAKQDNDYASLEPWTFYDQSHEFTAIHRPTVQQSLLAEHQKATRPLGLGR